MALFCGFFGIFVDLACLIWVYGKLIKNEKGCDHMERSRQEGQVRSRQGRSRTRRAGWHWVVVCAILPAICLMHDYLFGWSNGRLLDVPYVDQSLLYPTGCESASAVMVLRYTGVDISMDTFIDRYLPREDLVQVGDTLYGPDPYAAFAGDPRDPGGIGCYAPAIVTACERLILERGEAMQVVDLTGTGLRTLIRDYIDHDMPVMIWASMGMNGIRPGKQWVVRDTGETVTWTAGAHCLVLVGYDKDYYYFNDPQDGNGVVRYPKGQVEACYAEMGRQAVAVCKWEDLEDWSTEEWEAEEERRVRYKMETEMGTPWG